MREVEKSKRAGEQGSVAGKFILGSSGDTEAFGGGDFGRNSPNALFCKECLEDLSPLSSLGFVVNSVACSVLRNLKNPHCLHLWMLQILILIYWKSLRLINSTFFTW